MQQRVICIVVLHMPLPTIQQLNDKDNGHLLLYASMPKTVRLPKCNEKLLLEYYVSRTSSDIQKYLFV